MSIKESSNENAAIIFLDTDSMKGGICGIAKGTNQILTGTTNIDFVVGSTYTDTHIISGDGSNSNNAAIRMTVKTSGRVGINEAAPASLLHITANNDRSSGRLTNTYDSAEAQVED